MVNYVYIIDNKLNLLTPDLKGKNSIDKTCFNDCKTGKNKFNLFYGIIVFML